MGEVLWCVVKCTNAVRDPTKDQTIVLLYLMIVVGLLLWAFVRSPAGRALVARARRIVHM